MLIHETALVSKEARICNNVKIGPYSIIDRDVTIGEDTVIMSHSHIIEGSRLGRKCTIHQGAVIGDLPQIKNYSDKKSYVEIGDETVIREYVTIHRSSKEGAATILGKSCYIMAYSHIAHDCRIGDNVVIVNYTGIPGHVVIEDSVNISGYVGIHQFIKIGRIALLGGLARVTKDVPPFFIMEGIPAKPRAVNTVGLKRNNIPQKIRTDIKRAYKILFKSGLNTSQALTRIRDEIEKSSEINHLVGFVESSERGICK